MAVDLKDGILGSVVGATIGDSIGAVVEFRDAGGVRARTGGADWVDDMLEFKDQHIHRLGVFREDPPRGTGTDDTRLNHVFLECAARHGRHVNSRLVAMEYIARHQAPEIYYCTTPELARQHLAGYARRSAVHLGMRQYEGQSLEPHYRWTMNRFPGLSGLLSFQSVGLLFQGEPETAYLKAAELDFLDIGWARDATALLAAVLSAALGLERPEAREALSRGLETNPFELGGADGARRCATASGTLGDGHPSLPDLFEAVDTAGDDREAVRNLARAAEPLHPYDCMDILGVPLAIMRFTGGDPVRAVLMAANHRRVDEEGNLVAMRDVDCTGMVSGVIVGALNGLKAWPQEWVDAAVSANREVYGLDIAENARAFHRAVYG